MEPLKAERLARGPIQVLERGLRRHLGDRTGDRDSIGGLHPDLARALAQYSDAGLHGARVLRGKRCRET